MPDMIETKTLVAGLRPALKTGSAELKSARSTLSGMIATLDALDSLNGDILAAGTEAEMAEALAAARPKLKDVNGYTGTRQALITEQVAVVDEAGDPVLDEFGEPTFETKPVLDENGERTYRTETFAVTGFLDNAAALRAKLAALDTSELRAAIALAVAATNVA